MRHSEREVASAILARTNTIYFSDTTNTRLRDTSTASITAPIINIHRGRQGYSWTLYKYAMM